MKPKKQIVFLPVGSNLPFFRVPFVTMLWALICTGIYFFISRGEISQLQGASFEGSLTYQWAVLPHLQNEVWKFVSYQFVHASFGHLLANMWYLIIFGWILENALGSVRFLILSLVGGAFAVLPELFIQTEKLPIVGASGSVAFIMGAVAFMFPASKIRLLFLLIPLPNTPSSFFIPTRYLIYIWLGFQFFGLAFHAWINPKPVAYATHLAGFLIGALVGLCFQSYRQRKYFNVDLSGKELKRFYAGLQALQKNKLQEAYFEFQSLSDRYPWLLSLQLQLLDVCLQFNQKPLFLSVWKNTLPSMMALKRYRELVQLILRYREEFSELPEFDLSQGVKMLEHLKGSPEAQDLEFELKRYAEISKNRS